jgi:diguanylate cyclase (GGDEF)-like protein
MMAPLTGTPMATIPDDEDTIEAQAFSTSLDPYGQLLRMLLPRASGIAIFDHSGLALWTSDGCEGPDIPQLIEEALDGARQARPVAEERDGIQRSWGSDTGYVFILREGRELLGAVAVSCRGGKESSRPFSFILGLLRPALKVLKRELCNQFSIGDLQRNLTLRDGDLELLLGAGGTDGADSDDFEPLLRNCGRHMDCAVGALLVPDRKISLTYSANKASARADGEMVERVQRNLMAWSQVQRRTLTLNKAPPNNPFGTEAYKILACPVRQGAQHVVGLIVLFRSATSTDFSVHEVRIVEMIARRIAHVLQNTFDPATGLLSRAAFEQRALTVIGNGAGVKGQHCVAYADVDRLHVVNDNHGMHVGDEVIRAIAEAIRGLLPANCSASHISGDRFAMFLADTGIDAAEPLLATLCRNINALDCRHEDKRLNLSLSIGVASVPSTKHPLSHALATAEVACKAAKDRGRGRVEAYHDADHSIVRRYEDMAFVGVLRDAIASDRFRMEAQPIAHLGREGKPRRFELLLRMIDPTGDNVPPDKFFSAAERYQMATDIDRWVVQYTLEILSSAAPALQALGVHFAINLSGQSIGDDQFPVFLEGKLREYNLPPSLLSFEITETAAVANIVRAEMLIRRLQDLGHEIALDDFGRGLSSLTYLKSLSVSDLKIDGGLVRDLAGNARSQAMVNAIVQLAQAMKLRTTAECVESEAIQATCTRLGVDYGQGFAIGRPRPLELVLQELLRGAPTPRSVPNARSRIAS